MMALCANFYCSLANKVQENQFFKSVNSFSCDQQWLPRSFFGSTLESMNYWVFSGCAWHFQAWVYGARLMPRKFLKNLTCKERTSRSNRQLSCLLAFVAEAINAGGFLAVQRLAYDGRGVSSCVCFWRWYHSDIAQLGKATSNAG